VLKIGKLVLPYPFVLAPMAGVSDLPFRLITRSFGAPLAFTEMIDVKALATKDKRTCRMLSTNTDDRPLGVQLLGNAKEDILRAIDILREYRFELLDFNAACPTPKIARKGKGAALLQRPDKLGELLKTLVEGAQVPVTVKIRIGWDADSINAREVALSAEEAGVSALFVHGRTKMQGYSGTVDYKVIKDVKEALRIPVIASGDNLSISSVRKMFNETGCDGVAIARGSLGNPWIFSDLVKTYEQTMTSEAPGVLERLSVMRKHLDLVIQYYGEERGLASFRKFFIWYTRGLSGVKPLRDRAFRAGTVEELLKVMEDVRAHFQQEKTCLLNPKF
jgi:tRNA-dihydrouridine synthase B